MAKTLHLLRHAEAAAKEARQDDKARELTQAGIKDSMHLGAWLLTQNITFDLIVSSSALRAEQTAGLIVESMKLENAHIRVEDVLNEASVRQLLQYINNLDDGCTNVLLTGHNPAISYLAEYLTKADIHDMSPGALAIIHFDLASWKEVGENTGKLVNLMPPSP